MYRLPVPQGEVTACLYFGSSFTGSLESGDVSPFLAILRMSCRTALSRLPAIQPPWKNVNVHSQIRPALHPLPPHIIVLQMVVICEEQYSFVLIASYSLNEPCRDDLHTFPVSSAIPSCCRCSDELQDVIGCSGVLGSCHIFPVKL